MCCFDIEATNIPDIKQAAMYVWQFAIESDLVVIGRTWHDFLTFLEKLKAWMPAGCQLIIYVHNLSYEFQFLRGIYHFTPEEVFATDNRKVLRCDILGAFEFRCSYFLSNSSLDFWSGPKGMNVKHQKQSGEDFDYSVQRWPWTQLTAEEYKYCVYDVLAVTECVHRMMELEHDTLATIPLTNTGYVRRIVKAEMQELGPHYIADRWPSFELFTLLREAFRGGNAHANRYYTGLTVRNVHSADRSSSYPDVQCNLKFPIGKFHKALPKADVPELIRKGYAVICRVTFRDIALRNPWWGFPYIPKDKCKAIRFTADNGRILHAEQLSMAVTDIDLRIILKEYNFSSIEFDDVWFSLYGPLPDAFTRTVKRLYHDKTEMKGTDREKTPEYQIKKGQINSCYGMTAQNPLKDNVLFLGLMFKLESKLDASDIAEFNLDEPVSMEDKYAELRPWLPYQWAVWTTALARYELEKAMWKCVDPDGICRLIYIDTDSLYYEGDEIDFSDYNRERILRSRKTGSWAIDGKGHPHYMGVLEPDEPIDKFKTWGAKKYIYERAGELKCTISGVNKKEGGRELKAASSAEGRDAFEIFDKGFIFRLAGGEESRYNDEEFGIYHPDPDHSIFISANLHLEDSTYTISLTEEYNDIVNEFQRHPDLCAKVLDMWESWEYNEHSPVLD